MIFAMSARCQGLSWPKEMTVVAFFILIWFVFVVAILSSTSHRLTLATGGNNDDFFIVQVPEVLHLHPGPRRDLEIAEF